MLTIDRRVYFEKVKHLLPTVPEAFQNLLEDVDCTEPFVHKQFYGTGIADTLKEMHNPRYSGLAAKVYLESKALELLYKQIEQFRREEPAPTHSKLYSRDLEMVRSAKDLLVSNLRNAPTIKELSVKVGLSSTKLKKDFKIVYGKTIYNYLRDERLAYAAFLLRENHRSVREVAYEAGYINQSHFARRFKEAYGVLPKDYAKGRNHNT